MHVGFLFATTSTSTLGSPFLFYIIYWKYGGGAVALGIGLKQPKSKDDYTENQKAVNFNLLTTDFFQILAHPVFKM